VIDRRKQGSGVPLGYWFRGQLSGFLRDLLLSGSALGREIFDQGYVLKLIERHERGQDLGLQLWTLISFELWCRTFLDRTHARPACSERALSGQRAATAIATPRNEIGGFQ
jgi:asparagine synthase (glutamine-hydrolysing)